MRRLERLPARVLPGGLVLHVANGFRARLIGLAGMAGLPAGHALLIPRCRSVHTFGMRFTLDLVFVDARGRPLALHEGVPPGRFAACRDGAAVVETRAGEGPAFATVLAASPGGRPAAAAGR